MNLFVLDEDFNKNASYHVNRHIVKMPLEAAQLLCTVINENIGKQITEYKSTHKNHGITRWVGKSLANFIWTINYGLSICKEYTYRYCKKHKCEEIIQNCIKKISLINFDNYNITNHYLAMPDKYKSENVVISYRMYYIHEKQHLAQYKNRERPSWFK